VNHIQEKNTPPSTLWIEAGIAPLDYCSLERAARLLRCEEEDLWHWQDCYYIDFYARVHMMDGVEVVTTIESEEEYLINIVSMDSGTYPFTFPFLDPSIINHSKMTGIDAGFVVFKPLEVSAQDVPHLITKASPSKVIVQGGEAEGVLRISGRLERKQHSRTAGETYVSLVGKFKNEAYSVSVTSKFIHLSRLNDKNLYITRKGLEDIYQAKINNGFQLFSSNAIAERMSENGNEKKTDMRGFHHSISRESHIMALVYSMLNYKDEIYKNGKYGKSRHVAATLNHWAHIGGGLSEPSEKHLSSILRDMTRLPEERTTAGVAKMKMNGK
jgi:hypothetical protein